MPSIDGKHLGPGCAEIINRCINRYDRDHCSSQFDLNLTLRFGVHTDLVGGGAKAENAGGTGRVSDMPRLPQSSCKAVKSLRSKPPPLIQVHLSVVSRAGGGGVLLFGTKKFRSYFNIFYPFVSFFSGLCGYMAVCFARPGLKCSQAHVLIADFNL